ncbi:MAG: globin domain-containing protein [Proteobacteria bacterium]|nr:globin domain-containing protein [Pseudomonadota bacterium]
MVRHDREVIGRARVILRGRSLRAGVVRRRNQMSLDVEALRGSFQLVVERSPGVVHRFYEILFTRYPVVRPLFSRNSGANQEAMLTSALVAVLDHLEDGAWLTTQLSGMGGKHLTYGVEDHMYSWVGECLVAALQEAAGDAWSTRIEQAWLGAFGAISGLMLDGARAARAAEPA